MRVADVRYEELNAEQKRLYDIIAGSRKSGLGGPFSVLVRIPHVAEPANGLHNAFRLSGKLDRRIFELLILMVARQHTTEFAWVVHEALALKAGLDPAVIAAVRTRRVPDFRQADERLTYDLVSQLLETSRLNEDAYRRGLQGLGLDLLIELTSAVPASNGQTPLAAADV